MKSDACGRSSKFIAIMHIPAAQAFFCSGHNNASVWSARAPIKIHQTTQLFTIAPLDNLFQTCLSSLCSCRLEWVGRHLTYTYIQIVVINIRMCTVVLFLCTFRFDSPGYCAQFLHLYSYGLCNKPCYRNAASGKIWNWRFESCNGGIGIGKSSTRSQVFVNWH